MKTIRGIVYLNADFDMPYASLNQNRKETFPPFARSLKVSFKT